jgi:LysR family nitrogen assimilation transcriptional regulator
MDLNQIERFLRVAELGSINRAAKELGLSQPALSRSLSQLEHDLGQQLVVRCRTGITITEAGSILASRGLALLSEAGAIREELASDPAARVVVGMPAALRHLVTLPALQLMRNKSPGTAVRVHEGFNVFLRDMMNHGLLDMAVIAMEKPSETSIVPELLLREPLVLVRSAELPPPITLCPSAMSSNSHSRFPVVPMRCAASLIERSANAALLRRFRSSPRTRGFVLNSSDADWSDRR